MLIAALRDMHWRRRRFAIAVLSTAIIFAMTLVLTGPANGFRTEAVRTVDAYAGGTATLGDATRNVDIFGAPER